MKTKAVRLYGEQDLRLEDFELSPLDADGVRARVISDSLCMSSYKAAVQGAKHKRVPNNVAENPIIIGHEFCGEIIEVGENWRHKFKPGDGFAIQPAHFFNGALSAPGYSYRDCGGDATVVNIPKETLLMDCLLTYDSDVYFYGSLAEPMSCIIGSFHAMYHTTNGSYVHQMGIRKGGSLAILAGAGPMGLGAIDYALHGDIQPSLVVVTDIDDSRLARAAEILSPAVAEKAGVKLVYCNTGKVENPVQALLDLNGGNGYDDVFVFAAVKPVVEMGDQILGRDGCLNFFAGPLDPKFSAMFNFYHVHYASTHLVGTSGGNTTDMIESLSLMEKGLINPAAMITHIGGLDAAKDATLNLPTIKGGKKLIYTHIEMPLTAIEDFAEAGKTDPRFAALDKICRKNNNLWSAEAEAYLLSNF